MEKIEPIKMHCTSPNDPSTAEYYDLVNAIGTVNQIIDLLNDKCGPFSCPLKRLEFYDKQQEEEGRALKGNWKYPLSVI